MISSVCTVVGMKALSGRLQVGPLAANAIHREFKYRLDGFTVQRPRMRGSIGLGGGAAAALR